NLLAFYDRNRQFAPYLTAGIGYLGASVNGGGDENRPSATAGAGFKWRLGQSRFSIRNEYRARLAYEQDFNFIDFIATLGLEYRFGGPRQRDDLPRDSDGDGVLDMWDECPDTPPGVAVTSRGCEIKRMDRDEDNDRVFDDRDECPGTPEGMPVDPYGCSLDSDRDGVTTEKDRCPGSRPGARVDEFGCENDSDADGVPDHLDRCPGTRPNARRVDQYGCEIRDVINLPGVNFQSGSDLLLAGAERLIQDLAVTLIENDYLQIEVAGHTDDQGSVIDNQGLSDRRAKTVYDYLIRYGVDPTRLSFRGYGESQPIADNTTADGRATNRRVELRVVRDE
ncbi:MAG: OmpA family protein, partial [Chromatiales bacterium]